jgi:ATP-dependent exoDNAse (exonuclease V) alpha subunit
MGDDRAASRGVRLLNELARDSMREAGRITGRALDIGGLRFAAGDRVVVRLNAPDLDVQNGTRGTAVTVDRARHAITIALPDGSRLRLPSRYIHPGTPRGTPAVEHGYALTAHLVQGMTADCAFILGSETRVPRMGLHSVVARARAHALLRRAARDLRRAPHRGAGRRRPFRRALQTPRPQRGAAPGARRAAGTPRGSACGRR